MRFASDYLAVPATVESRTAVVWIGSTIDADPGPVTLVHPPSNTEWTLSGWQRWSAPDGARVVRHLRFTLNELQPSTKYPLEVRAGGAVRASAELTTLPDEIPPVGDPPFTILLGSCFARRQDKNGRVGRTFVQLPEGARPSIKFLVGDQVYLDSPWYRFMWLHSEESLAQGFVDEYVQTWDQAGEAQGFRQLLTRGGNYFTSDDHEFWNNAPFPSTYAVNTWTAGNRARWWRHAIDLYRAFQTTASRAAFAIGDLQVLVLDTRINRQSDRSTFLSAADFQAFEHWVAGLTAPGLLVVGQPLFAEKARWSGNLADWNLPDFDQYADVCRVLLGSTQSILILTGDVHFGRIASAPLDSGAELVEVIASPMALVDPTVGGRWREAPEEFPDEPIPGLTSVPIRTDNTWQRFANHFLTLELNQTGGGFRVRVRAWETDPPAGTGGAAVVADRILKRVV